MKQALTMVEVEEIELDLALSIGGKRKHKHKHMLEMEMEMETENIEKASAAAAAAAAATDKREIQALMRMEAKKKRDQKRDREPDFQLPFKRDKTDFSTSNNAVNVTAFPMQPNFTTLHYFPLHHNASQLPFSLECFKGPHPITIPNSSNASSSTSSALSDYQTSSREEGGSSDSHSHSVHSLAEPTQLNTCKEMSQPEENACASSYPMKPKQRNNGQERKHIVLQTQPEALKQETAPTSNVALPIDKALFPNENSTINNTKVDTMGKPPKPLSQTCLLPQMPYVSTKGINGKTVNGFLYKYTKSEVSIVCVCHGSTFSPAEFVQHAGGTDISHPLRHITVIPSAFG
ncbi:hypothetical protein Fmac_028254 [Flemingia macrophylla]|uniref:Ninja-family protein n=1 Tax=Flemingia macrophylla TaxID=520843 RepID=A0ABD1L6Z5_9FABA